MKRAAPAVEQLVVEVLVRDIRRSVAFYRALGFQLLRDGGDFVELTWEEHRLFLAESSAFHDVADASPAPPPAFPAANVRVMVLDVDELWRRAQRAIAQFSDAQPAPRIVIPIADRYYGLRDFTLADPDGFGLRFATPR